MAYNTAVASEDQRLFKAAFIYNFAKFTRWPENLDDNKKDAITLCTLGKDQLNSDLTRLQGTKINKKKHTVPSYETPNNRNNLKLTYTRQTK